MKTIMVVDDTPDILEITKAVLESNGFKVITFSNPEKALETIKKGNKTDLIVLDMRMPEMNGPDFCKEVRESKLKNLKIVYFTASSERDESLLKKYNVLGYIFKPFDNDKLVEEIKKYLEM